MEESIIPKIVLYMNLETTRWRGDEGIGGKKK
jgi:hypothetical protein